LLLTGGEKHLQYNVRAYQVLGSWFIFLGTIGIGIGLYGLIMGQGTQPTISFTLYAFGFAVFGMIFVYIFHLVKKIAHPATSVLQLSESEKKWVKGIRQSQILSLLLIAMGIMGMGLGIFNYLFREEALYGQVRTGFFILYSINFSIFGWILFKVCRKLQLIGQDLNT